jgi:integrase/recombinase XerD
MSLDFSAEISYENCCNSADRRANPPSHRGFSCCNRIVHSVSAEVTMREQPYCDLTLFGSSGSRKYLSAAERRRFLESAQGLPPSERLFCLMLAWSGARISEVLALTPAAIDLDGGVACIETLKRRKRGIIRQVPLPDGLLRDLARVFRLRRRQRDPRLAVECLWHWSRTTAWRHIKAIMRKAGIFGAPAMPKGLRHGFGVCAFQANVPPHLVQRWLGHASLRTTAIYADVLGPDERAFAARMWRKHTLIRRERSGSSKRRIAHDQRCGL